MARCIQVSGACLSSFGPYPGRASSPLMAQAMISHGIVGKDFAASEQAAKAEVAVGEGDRAGLSASELAATFLAGSFAGFCQTVVLVPSEAIKVKLQVLTSSLWCISQREARAMAPGRHGSHGRMHCVTLGGMRGRVVRMDSRGNRAYFPSMFLERSRASVSCS